MRRRIGVGVGLEINNEPFGVIPIDGPAYALFHLFLNRRQLARGIRREGIHVAIRAPPIALAPIAVWAGKMPVYNDLEYTLAIVLLAQVSAVALVSWLSFIELRCHN